MPVPILLVSLLPVRVDPLLGFAMYGEGFSWTGWHDKCPTTRLNGKDAVGNEAAVIQSSIRSN
jgi:hypothetical protein